MLIAGAGSTRTPSTKTALMKTALMIAVSVEAVTDVSIVAECRLQQ